MEITGGGGAAGLPTIRTLFFDLGETLVHVEDRSWVAGARETLAALRAQHRRLGIISNTGDLSRERLTALLPADFDFRAFEPALVILSSEVGVEKPSPEIFRKAAVAAGVAPSECLFCTEDLADTLAAQRVGMLAARLQAPPHSDLGRLVDVLTRLGLLSGPAPG